VILAYFLAGDNRSKRCTRHSAQRPSFWYIFIGKTMHTACPGAAADAGARRLD
jgi:hypothetical protein